jgi:hypothetical protein
MTRELFLLSPYRVPSHHTLALTADDAAAFLNGYLALWHPAALRGAGQPPRISPQYDHEQPTAEHVYAVPASPPLFLPDDWEHRLKQVGAVSFRATANRDETVANLLEAISARNAEQTALSQSFFGLGLGYMLLEALFDAMDHAPQLNTSEFWQDVTKAVEAPDAENARNHLLTAAGKLREARDILYPSSIHLLDLAIVADVPIQAPLELGTPVNFLLPAERLAMLAETQPQWLDKLRERVNADQAEVCGGPYRERDDALLPLESQLWNLRKGLETYQSLTGRDIQVHGRKRFAASVHTPGILSSFSLDKTILLPLDEGIIPQFKSAVVEWSSPEGRRVSAFTHKTLPAEDPLTYLHLAHHLSRSIMHDFTAVITLLHNGKPETPWYRDWLELNRLASLFGELTTLSRFLGEVPAGEYPPLPKADDFHSNYLHDLADRHEPNPVSRFASAVRMRRQLDAAWTLAGLYRALVREMADKQLVEQLTRTEEAAELSTSSNPAAAICQIDCRVTQLLADRLLSRAAPGNPGHLFLNPCSFPRRIAAELPGVRSALPAPAKATQVDGDKAKVVVEVPAFGFAWVPQSVPPGTKVPMPRGHLAEDRFLHNDFLEAEVDPQTGGLRLVRDLRRHVNRLGQQLVFGPGSAMRVKSINVASAGPALAEIVSSGALYDSHDQVLANWKQRFRVWWGRPLLELYIELDPTSPPSGYPWHAYFGARFAWRDEYASLFRGVDLRSHLTTHNRPEAADYLEVRTGPVRTAILTAGLPFCQRQGQRMLDVVLLPEGETARAFDLAVGVDLDEPAQVAQDWLTPPVVVATASGPPHIGASGWLFHLDAANVIVTSLRPALDGADAVIARFVECQGVSTAAELRCTRNPVRALHVDERDRSLAELPVSGDIVTLNLAAHDMLRVRVEFS